MPEDYITTTVDGARGFALSQAIVEDKEYYGNEASRDYIDEDDVIDDDCNCSDPGCPCNGHKIRGV